MAVMRLAACQTTKKKDTSALDFLQNQGHFQSAAAFRLPVYSQTSLPKGIRVETRTTETYRRKKKEKGQITKE